jgi:hypothetical protein
VDRERDTTVDRAVRAGIVRDTRMRLAVADG